MAGLSFGQMHRAGHEIPDLAEPHQIATVVQKCLASDAVLPV
jgi:hypothetical protein